MNREWAKLSEQLSIEVRNFIDGRTVPCDGPLIAKYSPRDGRLLYQFGSGDERDAQRAVQSAKRAFEDGRWSALPVTRRKDILYAFSALIKRHCEELALLECLDVGKPITDAVTFDIPAASEVIRYSAEAADKVASPVFASDQTSLSYQLRRPLGVVAGIVGWNFPLLLAAGKIGPALATGNSLVVKPSELTSLSTVRLAKLALEAGVPEGVLNVIHGGAQLGAALANDPDVDLVTFTGSTHTGKKILVSSANSNMKRMILECGGKAPNIVFDDCADIRNVADAIIARAFWNQGQVCTASSRLLVQDSIKNELLPVLIEKTAMLTPKDPLEPETTFGALVSQEHKNKVLAYIDIGHREGARMLYQSMASPPFREGFYVGPAIFDGVSPTQTIAREEIFGPVLSVMSFRDEAEAIKMANSTVYGLSAIVWTKDMGRAHRVTREIKAGWVTVNATERPSGGPGAGVIPIGGHKESGLGVEGGIEGLEAYTSQTTVQLFV